MEYVGTISLAVAIVATLIAVWQGLLSRAQLVEAKATKTETEKLLADIKERVTRIEGISDETRKDVRDQVARLIDKQDENFKVLLNAPKDKSQSDLLASVLPSIMQNPEMMIKLVEIGKNMKNS